MELSYSVRNLRSIKKMPPIDLRPITVLVGKNSSGKSTFLRTFPLIRQSLETKSSAPILWFGDLVDFGEFKSAVADNDDDLSIFFEFQIKELNTHPYEHDVYGLRRRRRRIVIDDVSIKYGISLVQGKTSTSSIELDSVSLNLSSTIQIGSSGKSLSKFEVNGKNVLDFFKPSQASINTTNLFSSIQLTRIVTIEKKEYLRYVSPTAVLTGKIAEIIKPHLDKRITPENLNGLARRVLMTRTFDDKSLMEISDSSEIRSFARFIEKIAKNQLPKIREELSTIYAIHNMIGVLEAVGGSLGEFFAQTQYLGPARARSERFYRYQELEVSEITPDGQNFPMFLNSLTAGQMRRLSGWIEGLFGYGIELNRTDLPPENRSI